MKDEMREKIDIFNRSDKKIPCLCSHWSTKKLGAFCTTYSGGTPKRTQIEFYSNGIIPWIKSGELNNRKVRSAEELITQNALRNSSAKLIYPNTILLALYGATAGVIAISEIEGAINQAILAIVPNAECNNLYLYYYLESIMEDTINNYTQGGQPNLNAEIVKSLMIFLPSLPEQQKIATIISTWDKAIELKEQLIEAKKQQKKGLMKKLLTGKMRLPGFDGAWKQVRLGDIFERIIRKNTEGNTNVLTISAQRGLINQEDYFNKSVASAVLDNYFLLRKDEFAYNKSYSNGYPMGAIKRLNIFESGVVTTLYICFRLIDKSLNNVSFYENYFESGLLIEPLKQIAHEGSRAHGLLNVTPKDFFDLKIMRPPCEEQGIVAEILTNANKEVELIKKELAEIKLQKKGLMKLLLTGIVRVQC